MLKLLAALVTLLVLLLGSFTGGYRLARYCDENEIDLRWRLRWFRLSHIRQQILSRWAEWREAVAARRAGLVRLPGGCLMITSMSINGGESELLGEVPADLFHPLAYGLGLPFPSLESQAEIAVTFCNRSRYTFEVKSLFHVTLPPEAFATHYHGALVPLNPFTAEPGSETTMSIKVQKACRVSQFRVHLPKYVKPPEPEPAQ